MIMNLGYLTTKSGSYCYFVYALITKSIVIVGASITVIEISIIKSVSLEK